MVPSVQFFYSAIVYIHRTAFYNTVLGKIIWGQLDTQRNTQKHDDRGKWSCNDRKKKNSNVQESSKIKRKIRTKSPVMKCSFIFWGPNFYFSRFRRKRVFQTVCSYFQNSKVPSLCIQLLISLQNSPHQVYHKALIHFLK